MWDLPRKKTISCSAPWKGRRGNSKLSDPQPNGTLANLEQRGSPDISDLNPNDMETSVVCYLQWYPQIIRLLSLGYVHICHRDCFASQIRSQGINLNEACCLFLWGIEANWHNPMHSNRMAQHIHRFTWHFYCFYMIDNIDIGPTVFQKY